MKMNIDNRAALITRIHELSKDGKLEWQKTTSDSAFQTTLGGFVIRSLHFLNPIEQEDEYELVITNTKGEQVDCITSSDFSGEIREGFFPSTLLEQIFTFARRTAMGSEKAIEQILNALNQRGA